MQPVEIFDFLSQPVIHRIDLYSAPSKIDKYFRDAGFLSGELNKSSKSGAEVGASLFKIVSVNLSGGDEISEKITLDFRDKGRLIEKISKESAGAMDIAGEPEKLRSLFHYKGPGHFVDEDEKLSLYDEGENELIEKDRQRQEKISKSKNILFTFRIRDIIYASIAKKDNFDLDALGSYGPEESHGILGLIERRLSANIILINPFWIWYEG